MFFHIKELQYHAKPEKPDPLFAKKLQEILGGQFGEISVAPISFSRLECQRKRQVQRSADGYWS